MNTEDNTNEQLIDNITQLKRRIVELETMEAKLEERTQELSKTNQELQNEVAKRKQIEEILKAERRRLFSVLDGIPAQVYLIAPDHSFRFSNRFFQERFGNPKTDPCYKVFHGRSEPCEQCTTFEADKRIKIQQNEFCYPDGYTYQIYDYAFTDVDGTEMLLSFALDITERKKMEEALRLSGECFYKAFNASPVTMIISSLEDGRLIDVNDSFCKHFGSSRIELVGYTLLEIGFWVDQTEPFFIKEKLMNNESVRDMEIRYRAKSGEQRLAQYSAERIDIDGELCMLSILTDITDRKKMETEINRLDRLYLVGEMAASIGHEIRNPMTTVRGFLQILKENEDYIKEEEYFDLMIEELDRANSIITEFLSLAKNKIVEFKMINLNEILINTLPLVQSNASIEDKSIKLELQSVPDLLVDEKEIRQLILNLVHNALESMSAGGNVTIRTFIEDETVVLSVQDEGYEIDHKLLDKLGTPFFTTKDQGTGLGLAICYGIALRHKAKIDIETGSTGTIFYVRFPNH